MYKTKINAGFATIAHYMASGTLYRVALTLGALFHYCERTYASYLEAKLRMFDGPLSDERIEASKVMCMDKPKNLIDAPVTLIKDEDVANNKDIVSVGTKLLIDTITSNQDNIKSAFNIGCYRDLQFNYAAEKFSNITFTSVDFPDIEDLKRLNKIPHRDNWKLVSGYPLDILRLGEFGSDLVFMSSTTCLCNSLEMDAYIDELSKHSKIVIINEGWGPVPPKENPFKLYKPEDIDPDQSAIRSMTAYSMFQHNYPEKFSRKGFRIEKSQLLELNKDIFILQFVAVNTKFI